MMRIVRSSRWFQCCAALARAEDGARTNEHGETANEAK
jgi:hypothetical protein